MRIPKMYKKGRYCRVSFHYPFKQKSFNEYSSNTLINNPITIKKAHTAFELQYQILFSTIQRETVVFVSTSQIKRIL